MWGVTAFGLPDNASEDIRAVNPQKGGDLREMIHVIGRQESEPIVTGAAEGRPSTQRRRKETAKKAMILGLLKGIKEGTVTHCRSLVLTARHASKKAR